MLTQTTLNGIQVLLYLGKDPNCQNICIPLDDIARELECSPTYLKKVAALLAKNGLVNSKRGIQGGVTLARPLWNISLRMVVEACQGLITADYCHSAPIGASVCGFHRAMAELHAATIGLLEEWTLNRLALFDEQGRVVPSTCKLRRILPIQVA